MNYVLAADATLTCKHTGVITLTASQLLKLGGRGVVIVVAGSVGTTCTQKPSPANPSWQQCTSFILGTGSRASHLTIQGQAVLTDALTGETNGVPENGVIFTAKSTQLKVAP